MRKINSLKTKQNERDSKIEKLQNDISALQEALDKHEDGNTDQFSQNMVSPKFSFFLS
jgi:peptidoglycan hydrolase CwlO-like protein